MEFHMLKCPDDNTDADTDVSSEPDNFSDADMTNAKRNGRLDATPMNIAPVSVELSPGKSTAYADYTTVVDCEGIRMKATPTAIATVSEKKVLPSEATPADSLLKILTRKGTPAPLAAGI